VPLKLVAQPLTVLGARQERLCMRLAFTSLLRSRFLFNEAKQPICYADPTTTRAAAVLMGNLVESGGAQPRGPADESFVHFHARETRTHRQVR
jgi:hypothetical protein